MQKQELAGTRSGGKKKYSLKAEMILIASLLLAGAVFTAVLLLSRHSGATVTVRVGGETVESFPLSRDRTYEITGLREGRNLLIIKDGEAWIQEADCPDGLCVHMGRIRYAGQSIVCLPHQVVVQIEDDPAHPSEGLDAVSE